jgi:DnaK suppressor protein
MTSKDVVFFKNYLLNQKSSLLNKTREFKSAELGPLENKGDDAEVASRDLTMNVSLHLVERDRSALMQIERALGKLAAGSYGRCEACEEKIEIKRLKARPFATLCIDCMEDQEDPRHFLN